MNTGNWGYKDKKMRGYEQANRVHKPKNKRMWGYNVTWNLTQTWECEDAGMQARTHEPEDMRM